MSANSALSQGRDELANLLNRLQSGVPFSFVRFSDGEIEILRNRKLVIENGRTHFRGRELENSFPVYDSKRFIPGFDFGLRKDLMQSALFKSENYFKGIPTWHNDAVRDREFLLRLNGGYDERMTFSDLLVNSNYEFFRTDVLDSLKEKCEDIFFIGNYRAVIKSPFMTQNLISIPDDFFSNYPSVRSNVLAKVFALPRGSIVLSSASSLSNIVGMQVRIRRDDLTFIDVGTAINDLLSLRSNTRAYHDAVFANSVREKVRAVRVKLQRRYRLRW